MFECLLSHQSELRPQALGCLFRLNNIHYIQEKLHEEPDQTFLTEQDEYLAQLCVRAQEEFQQFSFRNLKHVFQDPDRVLEYQNSSRSLLTLESGRYLKEKFSTFVSTFEQLYATHTGYSVYRQSLREELREMAMQHVYQGYLRFYQKYVSSLFTRHFIHSCS